MKIIILKLSQISAFMWVWGLFCFLADYVIMPDSRVWSMAIGFIAGIVGSKAMDLIRVILPNAKCELPLTVNLNYKEKIQ